MSASAYGSQGSLPVVSAANEPAFVREGSAKVKGAYQEGLGFEEMLLEQLGQALTASSGLSEETGEEGEAGAAEGAAGGSGSDMLSSSLLPRALAEGVLSGGGLGLASQLAGQLGTAGSTAGAAGQAPGTAGSVKDTPGAVAGAAGAVAGAAGAAADTPGAAAGAAGAATHSGSSAAGGSVSPPEASR
jgi:Rod binding domain-containing protein